VLVIVNAGDCPVEVSNVLCRTEVHERDTMCMEVYMPTDYSLASLQCTLDNEQDPEAWTCSYIGHEVGSPTLVGSTFEALATDDLGDALEADAEDHEWTIV